jgi:PAS domain S-box-containing protein
MDDAREVLRTLVFMEKQVPCHDGRWFAVRIMPYRTHDNVIDGLVITFTDVSASRALESTLRERASDLQGIAVSLPSLVWSCRPDGWSDFVNHLWADYTGVPTHALLGHGWLEQVEATDRERVSQEWRAAIRSGSALDTGLRLRRGDGAYRWFKALLSPIRDSQGAIVKWYGTGTDVDDLKRAQDNQPQLAAALDSLREGFVALDATMAITFFNPAAERMLARRRLDVVGKKLSEAFPGLRESELEQRIGQALRDPPASFELSFRVAPGQAVYRAKVSAQAASHGVSAFFAPGDELHAGGAPSAR